MSGRRLVTAVIEVADLGGDPVRAVQVALDMATSEFCIADDDDFGQVVRAEWGDRLR